MDVLLVESGWDAGQQESRTCYQVHAIGDTDLKPNVSIKYYIFIIICFA